MIYQVIVSNYSRFHNSQTMAVILLLGEHCFYFPHKLKSMITTTVLSDLKAHQNKKNRPPLSDASDIRKVFLLLVSLSKKAMECNFSYKTIFYSFDRIVGFLSLKGSLIMTALITFFLEFSFKLIANENILQTFKN